MKTRQAIRTILNNARDVIHELKGGGLLDEAEAAKLESVKKNYTAFSADQPALYKLCLTQLKPVIINKIKLRLQSLFLFPLC